MNQEFKTLTLDQEIRYCFIFIALISFLMMVIEFNVSHLFNGVMCTITYVIFKIKETGEF